MPLTRSSFKQPARPERQPRAWPSAQSFGATAVIVDVVAAQPKAPAPLRDKNYLRLVASMECFNCRVEGASQAAHPNSNKAKGRKACDGKVFPMCHAGAKDCHARLDQYKLVSRADMPDFERRAFQWTVRTLISRGLWPDRMPIPDLRQFDD